jgi:hypothetical protein
METKTIDSHFPTRGGGLCCHCSLGAPRFTEHWEVVAWVVCIGRKRVYHVHNMAIGMVVPTFLEKNANCGPRSVPRGIARETRTVVSQIKRP